jgi:hypothetical protein
MEWLNSDAVMHYSRYVKPQDGAVSFLLSSQQEAVGVQCTIFRKKIPVAKGRCQQWKLKMLLCEQWENLKFGQN